MKTFSFFNGKGGCGKTTHSMLFADWLSYHEKKSVILVDLEHPLPRLVKSREEDLRLMENSNSWLSRYMVKNDIKDSPYEIRSFDLSFLDTDGASMNKVLDLMWSVVDENPDHDYILYDFPAGFSGNSSAYRAVESGLLDFVVVPVEFEVNTLREGMTVANAVHIVGCKSAMFWNSLSQNDIKMESGLKTFENNILRDYGIEFLPERIKFFQKATRGADVNLFVRNTVCWPEEYVQLACPELPRLYQDIKNRLDSI